MSIQIKNSICKLQIPSLKCAEWMRQPWEWQKNWGELNLNWFRLHPYGIFCVLQLQTNMDTIPVLPWLGCEAELHQEWCQGCQGSSALCVTATENFPFWNLFPSHVGDPNSHHPMGYMESAIQWEWAFLLRSGLHSSHTKRQEKRSKKNKGRTRGDFTGNRELTANNYGWYLRKIQLPFNAVGGIFQHVWDTGKPLSRIRYFKPEWINQAISLKDA